MGPLARISMTGALPLLAMFGLVQEGRAADTASVNPALLAGCFAEVNAHDVDALKHVIAAADVQHDADQGLEGMPAAFRHSFGMFPDFHWTIEDSVVTNGKIVARFQTTATHDRAVQLGPIAPTFPPTGKKLVWQGISIWRVAVGKFVEHWGDDDLLGLAQQLRSQPAAQPRQP